MSLVVQKKVIIFNCRIRQKEKMLAMSCEVIDDDSDDDVTFIGSSFEPSKRTAQPL